MRHCHMHIGIFVTQVMACIGRLHSHQPIAQDNFGSVVQKRLSTREILKLSHDPIKLGFDRPLHPAK